MIFDFLFILLISVECERVFLLAKLFITERRNRLKDDIIEACTCLRAWSKEELENEASGGGATGGANNYY
jgi:hypothetical protein